MAQDLNIALLVRANTGQARRELAATGEQIRGIGSSSEEAARGADTAALAMGRLTAAAVAAAGAVAAALATGALSRTADEWSDKSSRIGAAVRDMAAAPELMQDMLRLANASYSDLNQTVETFARNIPAMRDLGFSTAETLDYTESLNHMLVITATRGERAASVQQALSKAMATGRLDALGLETVLASGGRVAEALAEQLGTTVSGLRGMASQGAITGDVIARALLGSLQRVRQEAGEMPATIGDGMLKIRNSVTALIGVIDQAFGASSAVAEWLDGVSQRIAALAAMDFTGLVDGMAIAATGLGQALLVLAATRIPALITAVAGLNVGMVLANAQFIAGAVAMRAAALASAAFTAASAGLTSVLTFLGGPLGLVAAGVTALGLYLWNSRRAAQAATAELNQFDNALRGVAGSADVTEAAIRKMTQTQMLSIMSRQTEDWEVAWRNLKAAINEAAASPEAAASGFQRSLRTISDMMLRDELDVARVRDLLDTIGTIAPELRDRLAAALDLTSTLQGTEQGIYKSAAALRLLQGTATEADRELLGLGSDGAAAGAAVASGLASAARAASSLSAELRGAVGALDALRSSAAATGFENIGLDAQIAALKAGRSAEDARVDGLVAEKRAELAPLLSQGAEVSRFAEQQLAQYAAGERAKAAKRAEIAELTKTRTMGSSSGGGATAEASAAQDLLKAQQKELALLRTLDPVQRAVIENREALATATAEEADQIRENIAQLERMREVRQAIDEVGAAGRSAFTGLVTGTLSLKDALGQVIGKLAEMAASSAWDLLWSGGTGGGGGLAGLLLGAFTGGSTAPEVPSHADGGQVQGVGGLREDNQLRWLSVGEYVVNAAATAANLPLLEAINRGTPAMELLKGLAAAPRLADGGLVGSASFVSALPGRGGWAAVGGAGQGGADRAGPQVLEIRLHLDNDLLRAEIEQTAGPIAVKVTRAGLEEFSHSELPGRQRQISRNPRKLVG